MIRTCVIIGPTRQWNISFRLLASRPQMISSSSISPRSLYTAKAQFVGRLVLSYEGSNSITLVLNPVRYLIHTRSFCRGRIGFDTSGPPSATTDDSASLSDCSKWRGVCLRSDKPRLCMLVSICSSGLRFPKWDFKPFRTFEAKPLSKDRISYEPNRFEGSNQLRGVEWLIISVQILETWYLKTPYLRMMMWEESLRT